MPLSKYLLWNSNYADFGIFENISYNFSIGNYIVILDGHLSLIYSLYGSLLFILIKLNFEFLFSYFSILIQSIELLLPSIFLYLKKEYYISYIYLLCPPIWFLNFNDVHIDVIIIPIIFFSLYFYHHNRDNYKYLFLIFIALFIKDYYSLLLVTFGIYIFIDLRKNFLISFLLILSGTFIFLLYYIYLREITTLSSTELIGDSEIFSGFYGNNFTSILINFFFEFDKYIFGLFTLKKIIYVLFFCIYFLVFVKFKFSLLIIFFPFLFINLFSTNLTFVSLVNHHIVVLIPVFTYNLLLNKNKIQLFINKFNIKYFYIIFFILFSPNFISPYFYFNNYDLFNFSNYENLERKNKIKNDIERLIDNKSIISIQNNLNNNYLSFRKDYLLYPEGVFDFKYKKGLKGNREILASYIILDMKEDTYIYDKKCKSLNSLCSLVESKKYSFQDLVNKIINDNNFRIIYNYDNFYIFKRYEKNE